MSRRKYKPRVIIPHVSRGVVRVDWDGFSWYPVAFAGPGTVTTSGETLSISWSADEFRDVLGVR